MSGGSVNAGRLVSRSEWRFVWLVGALLLIATSIPYAVGAARATEGRIFGGFVYALEDCYSYLAKMRQGAEGAWLFHIAYTPEAHVGTLFFPFHLALGKLAALLPGGALTARMVWAYHGARVVLGLGLLLTVYRFLAAFTDRVAVRRLAWLLTALSGGLGWLLVALGEPDWLGHTPLDFVLPEGFTFLVLYAFPHIALGRTLLLWGFLFLLRAWGERAPVGGDNFPRNDRAALGWAAAAGVAWLLTGLIVPFYVAVAWAVTAAAWLVLGIRRRRPMWRPARLAVVAGLISAPVVAYSAWVFSVDPVYQVWASQNLILSPHPLHYLAAYGVPLTLAAVAARNAWRDRRPVWFALAWVGVVPFLIYLPFNLQRRLVEGVQVPLSLLAARGLLGRGWQGLRLRLVAGVLVVALSLTNVMTLAGGCLALRGRPAPVYRNGMEVAALDWLSGRVEPDDVVMASYRTGNYLPARVRARVFVGHGPETVRFDEKRALMKRFFAGATEEAWRRDLLDEFGVDYVFWGPAERAVGDFDPRGVGYLTEVYDVQGYTVFEVEG